LVFSLKLEAMARSEKGKEGSSERVVMIKQGNKDG